MKAKKKQQGIVVKSTRNLYQVNLEGKVVECNIRGRIAEPDGSSPTAVKVGDHVCVRLVNEREGVIEEILPRHSKLSRSVEGKAYREHIIAVNVDQMLVVMSTREPAFKSGLLDRYLVIAEKNGLKASVCINKTDLLRASDFAEFAEHYPRLGYPLFFTSAETGEGLDQLTEVLRDKVTVLVGHSGVGKSTLLKKIQPELDLKIADISSKTSKGRHTTTHVELYPLHIGGFVIDTPGVRELGFWDIFRDHLKNYFIEFLEYEKQCRFKDCFHLQEPGCAVKNAVETGDIFRERYTNYQNIYQSLRSASYELIKPR